jgi:hypothetical protein
MIQFLMVKSYEINFYLFKVSHLQGVEPFESFNVQAKFLKSLETMADIFACLLDLSLVE